jgi:metal-sulfur cluster biosynthetic enzyme
MIAQDHDEANLEGIAASRRAEVMAVLDAIEDPCSVAFGKPIGLVGMGIVQDVEIAAGRVVLSLLPTFPTCLFQGVFAEEIERRLRTLAWCEAVTVTIASGEASWDETRMSAKARERLGRGVARKKQAAPQVS